METRGRSRAGGREGRRRWPRWLDEGRGDWRRYLRDALRPEAERVPLSRWAVRADVVLAVLLTVVALVVAARYPGDGPNFVDSSVERGIPAPPPLPGPDARVRVGEGYESTSVPWPLVVLSALPLAVRRRYPLAAFAVVMGAMLVMVDDASWINVLTCVIGAYSAARYSRYRIRATTGLLIAAVIAGVAFRRTEPILPGWSSPAVVLLVAGVLASTVRFWQRRLAASRDRFTRLQQAQEESVRRAAEEERARIAAELHDVVTHNVSVMVIQAGAARKVMDTAPERSKEALLAVEAGGRAAMAELRNVMGLLAAPDTGRPGHPGHPGGLGGRAPDTPADGLEPQPGLDQLDALVERVRAAGTPVTVTVSPRPGPLPPGVELAAYRVVQEALTNTIRHAPGAAASVSVGHSGDLLEIEVTDSGAAHDAPAREGTGRGLIGLRERLAVYGGELTAGPTLAGGYRITARVPWRTS
ncbi:histidine kinase [Streptomyces sp. NPDC006997]|uniref:sensor histidine kinase n=1 Tax=Streptomyces sp. NPDC006997 TaxID=3155356 RepID=UPI0034062399